MKHERVLRDVEAYWPDLLAYHAWLHAPTASGQPAGRSTRARWRRGFEPTQIALDPDFFGTFYPIFSKGKEPQLGHDETTGRLDAIVGIASALAHVGTHVPGHSLSEQMAGIGADAAAISEVRFRRILESETAADLAMNLRPTYGIMRHGANLKDVAASLLDWTETRRRRWAHDYYMNTPSQAKTQGDTK